MTMWSSSDIKSSTNVIHHPRQWVEWTGEETLYEKMDRLNIGIGGSLTVDMNTAAVKASGSFRYITETRVRKYLQCVPIKSKWTGDTDWGLWQNQLPRVFFKL